MKKANNRRSLIILSIYVVLATLAIGPLAYSRSGNRIKNFFNFKSSQGRVATRGGNQTAAATRNVITPDTVSQIVALETEKASRTPTQLKIDSQLLQAIRGSRGEQMAAGVNLVHVDTRADDTGGIMIDINARVSNALINNLQSIGATVIYPSFEYNTIRAKADLSKIEQIAGLADVKFVKIASHAITSRMADRNRLSGLNSATSGPMASQVITSNLGSIGTRRASFAERAANVREQLSKVLAKSAVAAPYFTGKVESEGDRAHRAEDARSTF